MNIILRLITTAACLAMLGVCLFILKITGFFSG